MARERELEPDAEAVQRFAGRVDVDLAASVIEARQDGLADPGLVPLPAGLAREAETGAFRERPQRMGALFVATQEVPREEGRELLLRRWDSGGAPLPALPLPADTSVPISIRRAVTRPSNGAVTFLKASSAMRRATLALSAFIVASAAL